MSVLEAALEICKPFESHLHPLMDGDWQRAAFSWENIAELRGPKKARIQLQITDAYMH